MLTNLKSAFPDKPEFEIRNIADKVWQNIGLNLIEFIKLDNITKENVDDYVTIRNTVNLDIGLKKGKGVILVTAHFGNWEYIATSLAWKGYLVAGITHALENYLVDKMVKSVRAKSGATEFSHTNGVSKSLAWLRKNGIIEIAIDQSIAHGGIFVNFFNRPAAATPVVSLLARKSGAVVISAKAYRDENEKVVIEISEPIELVNSDNIRKDAITNTQKLTKIVEDWISKQPEYWFWVHNRWKRKPNENDG